MESPFTIEHIKDGNYIRVTVHVPVTRVVANTFTQKAEAEYKRVGARNYLIDVTTVPNISTVNDNIEYSAWDMKVRGAAAQVKRAILIAVDDDSHDLPIRAMQEMGFNVKKFTDKQKAIAWLTGA